MWNGYRNGSKTSYMKIKNIKAPQGLQKILSIKIKKGEHSFPSAMAEALSDK